MRKYYCFNCGEGPFKTMEELTSHKEWNCPNELNVFKSRKN